MSEETDVQSGSIRRTLVILAILVIVSVVLAMGYEVYERNTQVNQQVAAFGCSLSYSQYSSQWQDCLNGSTK